MTKRVNDLTGRREVVVGLFNSLFTDIRPKYQSLRKKKVHCGRILEIADDHGGFRPAYLGIHEPNIPSVGKEQQGRT